MTGLSPRVRGNRIRRLRKRGRVGSIPARAGQPRPTRRTLLDRRVYPRACGATVLTPFVPLIWGGLSPRVRGNLSLPPSLPQRGGSIPARAGQPFCLSRIAITPGVYPRACGATLIRAGVGSRDEGLSPRVRGNLRVPTRVALMAGSIPARAGQPVSRCLVRRRRAVYPRACGATTGCRARSQHAIGLSPRVRGNHLHRRQRSKSSGSIPARAGQPRAWAARRQLPPVYPRACGATRASRHHVCDGGGLSPRVRGNPIAS